MTDAEWVERIRRTAKHLRKNAISLRKYDFAADEARARELAALYIAEIADTFELIRDYPMPDGASSNSAPLSNPLIEQTTSDGVTEGLKR